VRTPLGEAAGIEGDNAIGFPQLFDHCSDQHRDQWPVIPGSGAKEVLQDQALDINQRRDCLGILAWQVRQQPLEVEIHMALAGLGLESLLIGHHEGTQTVHHGVEDVRGNDAVTQQFRLPLCPRRGHLFASSKWHADKGCWLEAIDTTNWLRVL
jgi:hypothetical protein